MNNRCPNARTWYEKCRPHFGSKQKNHQWSTLKEAGYIRLMDKSTFKHNSMVFGFVMEDLEEHHKMKDDHHVVHANRCKVGEDIQKIKGTKNLCQEISVDPSTAEDMMLKISNIPYSCEVCRNDGESTCPFSSMRSESIVNLNKESAFFSKSDEELL